MSCSYCGDDEFEAYLFTDTQDDDPVCVTAGCGLTFALADVNPEDLDGFSILTEAEMDAIEAADPDMETK